jgi:pSer/pThr/pTyr-binding forkhead associated (FHA) protein
MTRLIIVRAGQPDEVHEISGKVVTVGRRPENGICIPEPSVSGTHAQFTEEEGRYRLQDLDSTNKTYVNGVAIAQALLRGNCSIRFGMVECLFEEGPDARSKSAADPDLANKLREADAEIKKLREENRRLSEQFDAETKRVAALTLQSQTLHQNQQQIAAILKDSKEALAKALSDAEALRAERNELSKRVDELEGVPGGGPSNGSGGAPIPPPRVVQPV